VNNMKIDFGQIALIGAVAVVGYLAYKYLVKPITGAAGAVSGAAGAIEGVSNIPITPEIAEPDGFTYPSWSLTDFLRVGLGQGPAVFVEKSQESLKISTAKATATVTPQKAAAPYTNPRTGMVSPLGKAPAAYYTIQPQGVTVNTLSLRPIPPEVGQTPMRPSETSLHGTINPKTGFRIGGR
jgi:hypothetical protein